MKLPARIGKYELEEFLGGGMSHVYRARDTVIGRTVAVKILTEEASADSDSKARFLAEARMAGSITHENIISIYDFGEDDRQRPYIVMEFLRGEDLRHAIREGHTGDLRNQLKIALQIARALHHIHTQKIIHRDIKPENVHITTAGVVKLMDFGIAKTEGLAMTRAGYVLGTPYYMAPEQVMGQQITEQVDVYAFGVLLFELVTGVKPIGGDSVERIFYSILNEPPNLEPLASSGAPSTVCELVARTTMKNPAERPLGFGIVSAELEQILQSLVPEARPAEQAPKTPAERTKKTVGSWLNLRKLDMKIERLLRDLAARAGGPRAPQAALEIRQLVLEALDDRLAEMGSLTGGSFPFNRVEFELGLGEGGNRDLVEAVFADQSAFTKAVAVRIIAGGAQTPAGFTADVVVVESDRAQCNIRFSLVERKVPRVRLAVVRGAASRRSYTLRQERVCIGRGMEVTDATGRLLRRNDVAFEGTGAQVSRRHARLFYDWDSAAYYVVDERSSKGTQVCRGNTVETVLPGDPRGVRLESGDEIRLGQAVLMFKVFAE